MKCGLLGEHLGHSYSPQIHSLLADYEYPLYEKTEAEVPDFVKNGAWSGINVTIPYKKTVYPYCTVLSETARMTGSVNTLTREKNGGLRGDNTDVEGFLAMVRHSGVDVCGKKTLVLGSGGASASICAALRILGVSPVVISRSGEDNYRNLDRHRDAEIIVNTTPVGMYPKNGEAPLDLRLFPHCTGVLDIIYNPARTKLLLQAEELGIPCANGLYMLVAQAKRSCELFLGSTLPDLEIDRVEGVLSRGMRNLILVGMPGSGKSTLGRLVSEFSGRSFADADEELSKRLGMKVSAYLQKYGEEAFRNEESAVLEALGKRSGWVIATGGGAVLREENYAHLHQNGYIVWIQRKLENHSTEGRPLSQAGALGELYAARESRYRRFADSCVENEGTPEDAARQIVRYL